MRPPLPVPTKQTVLRFCLLVCVLNLALVGVLAATGTLKTAEQGDITYTKVEETPDGDIVIPSDSDDAFAVERPTDVDAFYNAIVRIQSDGPLMNPWGDAHTIQRYHYHPSVALLFYPLYFLGYLGFKIAWLLASLIFTAGGTYLLLRAEADHWGYDVDRRALTVLSVASLGFAAMVANFKTGQTSPLMYGGVALSWYLYRRDAYSASGAALIVPALVKPYFIAPLVVFFRRDRLRGLAGFAVALIAANIVALVVFGPDTVFQYYQILADIASENAEGGGFTNEGFGDWFSNTLKVFWWLGGLAVVAHLLSALPLAYGTLECLLERAYRPADLFCLAIVMPMFLIPSTTGIDLAVVLAAVVVLGFRLYASDAGTSRAFAFLGVAFILMQGHFYFMELFVGEGPEMIPVLASYETLIVSVITFIQPGLWGLFILFGLLIASVSKLVPWHEEASTEPAGRNPPAAVER